MKLTGSYIFKSFWYVWAMHSHLFYHGCYWYRSIRNLNNILILTPLLILICSSSIINSVLNTWLRAERNANHLLLIKAWRCFMRAVNIGPSGPDRNETLQILGVISFNKTCWNKNYWKWLHALPLFSFIRFTTRFFTRYTISGNSFIEVII
jgi:hypothetical protein